MAAELYYANGRADGRTDMTKLIVAFRNFMNAPKNRKCSFDLILLTDNYTWTFPDMAVQNTCSYVLLQDIPKV